MDGAELGSTRRATIAAILEGLDLLDLPDAERDAEQDAEQEIEPAIPHEVERRRNERYYDFRQRGVPPTWRTPLEASRFRKRNIPPPGGYRYLTDP